jgi:hypothetical protein
VPQGFTKWLPGEKRREKKRKVEETMRRKE